MTQHAEREVGDDKDRPDIGPADDGSQVGTGAAIAPVAVSPRKVAVPIGQPLGDLDEAYRLAQALSSSDMVPRALRGKPADTLAVLLYGRELGIGAMQSTQGVFVSNDGRPGLTAALWNALLRAHGHRVSSVAGTDDRGFPTEEVTVTRGDTGETVTIRWTIADAERANLCRVIDGKIVARSQNNKPLPWEQYPDDLLYARALVRAARRAAPEVAFGFSAAQDEAWAGPMHVNADGVAIVEAERVEPPTPARPDEPVDPDGVAARVRATVDEYAQPVADEPPPDGDDDPWAAAERAAAARAAEYQAETAADDGAAPTDAEDAVAETLPLDGTEQGAADGGS
jgi:hypothetical protein